MLGAIASKQKQLGGKAERVAISLGKGLPGADAAVDRLASDDFLTKLWKHDPQPWSSDPAHTDIIKNALGWLDFPKTVHGNAADLAAFANEMRKIYTHAVVLGMGGSSLAPDVLRETFGHVAGYPQLHVLDSSDPVQVARLEASLDLAHTLFIVASKSGNDHGAGGLLPLLLRARAEDGRRPTAPASNSSRSPIRTRSSAKRRKTPASRGFFENDPAIGGRYSALSYFGMVPAALAGYDVATILDRGLGELAASDRSTKGRRIPKPFASVRRSERSRRMAATNSRSSRTPEVAAFGAWAEQLVAESTGKSGTGIVPIEGETLGMPSDYDSDRVFVYVGAGLPADEHLIRRDGRRRDRDAPAHARGGGAPRHPPRDERPARHRRTVRALGGRRRDGRRGARDRRVRSAERARIQGQHEAPSRRVQKNGQLPGNPRRNRRRTSRTSSRFPARKISRSAPISRRRSARCSRSASTAITSRSPPTSTGRPITSASCSTSASRCATHSRSRRPSAFGPRFLHSTGQLHKGGPNTGIFIQITADTSKDADLQIPGMVTFATLIRAQALGDFESLDKRDRRGLRLHLSGPLDLALEAVSSRDRRRRIRARLILTTLARRIR